MPKSTDKTIEAPAEKTADPKPVKTARMDPPPKGKPTLVCWHQKRAYQTVKLSDGPKRVDGRPSYNRHTLTLKPGLNIVDSGLLTVLGETVERFREKIEDGIVEVFAGEPADAFGKLKTRKALKLVEWTGDTDVLRALLEHEDRAEVVAALEDQLEEMMRRENESDEARRRRRRGHRR